MTKLTELEKQKAITCVLYAKKSIECERYKLEAEYDKMSCYNEELEKKIYHAQEMEEFYSNLGEKLKEVL